MPKRTIEKLEALPWMTDDELGRIIEYSDRAAREGDGNGSVMS